MALGSIILIPHQRAQYGRNYILDATEKPAVKGRMSRGEWRYKQYSVDVSEIPPRLHSQN